MAKLKVEITSLKGELFNGSCHLAVVPSKLGDIGFMADHEVVVTALKEGQVTLYDEKQNVVKSFEVKSGFAEMKVEKLLVLID